jgi:ABC-type polysaccharide/polyol phosphate export permease
MAIDKESGSLQPIWGGDYTYVLQNLIVKDFKVRYRNMSLGVFWSLLNPLVMLGVLWFVFTKIFPNTTIQNFSVFVLCGLIPYNFFNLGWIVGTMSLVDNAQLIKHVPVPREVVPIAGVLSQCIHLGVQVCLLLFFVIISGISINLYWLLLPVLWFFEVIFVCGLALASAALNVYIRDMRYFVESANNILFWFVPIFYPFSIIPQKFREIYQFNPVAAIVLATRNILIDGIAPPETLLIKLVLSSLCVLCVGLFVFHTLKPRFYNYL